MASARISSMRCCMGAMAAVSKTTFFQKKWEMMANKKGNMMENYAKYLLNSCKIPAQKRFVKKNIVPRLR